MSPKFVSIAFGASIRIEPFKSSTPNEDADEYDVKYDDAMLKAKKNG